MMSTLAFISLFVLGTRAFLLHPPDPTEAILAKINELRQEFDRLTQQADIAAGHLKDIDDRLGSLEDFNTNNVHLYNSIASLLYVKADYNVSAPYEFAVRLVGGRGPFEGRVEMFHNSTWGTLYARHNATQQVANVICRGQAYSGSKVVFDSFSPFGPGNGPIWSHLICSGSEDRITACSISADWKDYRHLGYSHSNDLGVVCDTAINH